MHTIHCHFRLLRIELIFGPAVFKGNRVEPLHLHGAEGITQSRIRRAQPERNVVAGIYYGGQRNKRHQRTLHENP